MPQCWSMSIAGDYLNGMKRGTNKLMERIFFGLVAADHSHFDERHVAGCHRRQRVPGAHSEPVTGTRRWRRQRLRCHAQFKGGALWRRCHVVSQRRLHWAKSVKSIQLPFGFYQKIFQWMASAHLLISQSNLSMAVSPNHYYHCWLWCDEKEPEQKRSHRRHRRRQSWHATRRMLTASADRCVAGPIDQLLWWWHSPRNHRPPPPASCRSPERQLPVRNDQSPVNQSNFNLLTFYHWFKTL